MGVKEIRFSCKLQNLKPDFWLTPFNICRDGQCLTPDFGQDPVRLLEGLKSPWPYLSEVDERLSMISAGPHWPWKFNMSERLQAAQTANNFFVVGETWVIKCPH